ncbi:homeobox-DDT domain protein RLT2 isoform X2 [Syzygium oleosum]|uniref:homeobox-DDT domain protein RLT2 isoform X2 n=1 Tax=Syzygium oleosum TaxID=219896 RepID=UPI0024BABAD8|nr:homeobox-DDT domain protein RLT2 isoform X2 [Syzygium oleosum]
MEEEEEEMGVAAAGASSSGGGVAGGGCGGSGGGGGGGGGDEAEKKKPVEGEGKSKRKMKTASQLEILEKTYAVEPYPSEAIRNELSGQLGLSDRQLQMWFCHRRLKDRKGPSKRQRKDSPAAAAAAEPMLVGGDAANELPYGAVAGSSSFTPAVESWRGGPRVGTAVARISGDYPVMKRHYEPEPSMAERHAISFVEAQLGEPLRDDGPILGMEFDPLPPGAFGTPIGGAVIGQHKQTGRSFEAKYERSDAKSIKGVVRPVHEYQFLPEKPTVRAETYERVVPPYHHGSDSINTRISAGPSFLHANEPMPSGYGLQSRVPVLSLLTPPGKQGPLLSSTPGEYDLDPSKTSSTNLEIENRLGAHSVSALDNPLVSSDRRVIHNEELLRAERKRKSEEARIQREVEAHEKRIRKELKKQDIMRRKRDEQVRKEMERLDRERRKEEERLLREKQREVERYQREQRRELERREKFLQKESRRAEKMKRKEQVRREKEAARLKAASERAIARRMAKESVELIEDEQLELMEFAASSKGLPSIMSLDFETLQNLELFRDSMTAFPPIAVQTKKPFGIQPWSHSEENIGNLLMAWRFLITFADVLGLWPFILDEFVQAFHDYDARLLGEIHVALLRTIIKDIEDVARTPSTNVGANLNSVANPGGGHPHIVEGGYSWGFDIRTWQRQLNPLTWPEILRQFVLSAGFGPQLKKKNVEAAYLHDDHEGNDGQDIISILRNGAAAEHAFAKMQQRGFSNLRRSRHRLTPGTVKFAAFHVLSLEGDEGLTILEVADRIQKCGLRDLTTSKTPEASVAAALSRDTKLFERTAPSTYCVRPTYRKDPADAEAILSAARERIREFKSELVDEEEADDAERDEDSESESTEDPEVDDLNAELNSQVEVSQRDVNLLDVKTLSGDGKDDADEIDISENGTERANGDSSLMCPDNLIKDEDAVAPVDIDGGGIQDEATDNMQNTDIDESNPGAPWVQGLMEGEYSDLSVEERLNALVAIIGVAIEGNSIRSVLEERLEAATALKKQMLAEAQLDKRRTKEDYLMKIHYPFQMASKTEANLINMSSAEGKLSPLLAVDGGNNEMPVDPAIQRESMIDQRNPSPFITSEGNLQMQDIPGGSENFSLQQVGYAAEMSRSQLKSYIGYKAEELYVYRSLPLGQDRRRNRYWQFVTSNSRNDPGCGRLFVELHDGHWRIIDSEEGFNSLLASLDVRGIRESYLHFMLQRIESSFKESVRRNAISTDGKRTSEDKIKREALEVAHGSDACIGIDSPSSSVCGVDPETSETSTSFKIELGRNRREKDGALTRYQEFENWTWKECLSPSVLCAIKYGKERCVPLLNACDRCHEIHFMDYDNCPSCYWTSTTSKSELYLSESVAPSEHKLHMPSDPTNYGSVSCPVKIRLLKVLLALMEAFVPPEALESSWTDDFRKSWGMKLHTSSSASELLQALTLLESAIKRDYLSPNFETTNELLSISSGFATDISASFEALIVLPWIPQTTAAVALRLMEFDSAISYSLHQKVESAVNDGSGDFEFPSRYMGTRSWHNHDSAATPFRGGLVDENWVDSGPIPTGSGRRRGRGTGRGLSRTSGRRSQRRVSGGSKFDSGKKARVTNGERGRSRGRGGRRRGRRSTRNRQRAVKKEVPVFGEREATKEQMMEESPEVLIEDGWNGDDGNNAGLNLEEAENSSSSESSEFEDEDGQATGSYRYNLVADDYSKGLNGKADELSEASEDNLDGNEEVEEEEDEEDEDEGDDAVDDRGGDLDVREYINGEFDEEEEEDDARAIDGFENVDPDEGTGSTSSEYSD